MIGRRATNNRYRAEADTFCWELLGGDFHALIEESALSALLHGHLELLLARSQRRLRDDSTRCEPIQTHEGREPLEPGKIYELRFTIVPTARLFETGERIAIRIKGADDEEQ